jgi:hypothetical protein
VLAASRGASLQGNAAKRQRVFGVTLVRARPFYGFHADDAIFVKVRLPAAPCFTECLTLLYQNPARMHTQSALVCAMVHSLAVVMYLRDWLEFQTLVGAA